MTPKCLRCEGTFGVRKRHDDRPSDCCTSHQPRACPHVLSRSCNIRCDIRTCSRCSLASCGCLLADRPPVALLVPNPAHAFAKALIIDATIASRLAAGVLVVAVAANCAGRARRAGRAGDIRASLDAWDLLVCRARKIGGRESQGEESNSEK